jgi:hypothetical protein
MAIFSLQKKKDGARESFQSSICFSPGPDQNDKVYLSYAAIPFKLPWEIPRQFFS